jgi:hypothetical protein
MDLPIFELTINKELDSKLLMSAIALVDRPAVEENFLAFNQTEEMKFSVDAKRGIISGLAMASDKPIYRNIGGREFYVTIKPETVYQMVQKFFSLKLNENFNLMHDANQQCSGVTIFESFISDKERGIMPMKGFEGYDNACWFISAKIDNPEILSKVQSGEIKGFSIEGFFKMMLVEDEEELLTQEDFQLMEEINNSLNQLAK